MRIFAAASAILVLAACNPFNPDSVDGEVHTITLPAMDLGEAARTDDSVEFGYDEFDLDAASMVGQLPHIGRFDDADGYGTVSIDRWGEDTTVNFTLNTLDDNGWGMLGANLQVDTETGEASYSAYDLIGCSGDSEFDADFDEAPTDAEITAEVIDVDGVPMVEIQITGEFEGQPVTGIAVVPAAVDDGE